MAWDIETSGLDWQRERIATCQLFCAEEHVTVVRIGKDIPANLRALLSDDAVQKVFHHAMFDLRFMYHQWEAEPRNIACTKISSKLLDPEKRQDHSLKALVKRYLEIELDKGEQLSNWFTRELTDEQLAYAASDVLHLIPLLDALKGALASAQLLEFARGCYAHIPTRTRLDVLGYDDVYTY